MKSLFSIFLITMVNCSVWAGPSISGGIQPHPALVAMKLEKPRANVDYPAGSKTKAKAVLVLSGGVRIQINEAASLQMPREGVDYQKTGGDVPLWAQFQKVLALQSGSRIPVRLSFQQGVLVLLLPNNSAVEVSQIKTIQQAEAGVDFPTDYPTNIKEVLTLADGSRIAI